MGGSLRGDNGHRKRGTKSNNRIKKSLSPGPSNLGGFAQALRAAGLSKASPSIDGIHVAHLATRPAQIHHEFEGLFGRADSEGQTQLSAPLFK